ncbi:MAG: hypothetical protein PHW04_11320 [Candidatus Wallbacteria bacterium]|nr:hypothetical protein [Candidatus Wallbacteria bacterium]
MKKTGIVLPLVLVLLLVLCMLGLFMNKSAQHEYRFTYRSTDHLRALYIAQGAIQATLANLLQEMNRAGNIRNNFVSDGATANFLNYNQLDGTYKAAIDSLGGDLNKSDAGVIDETRYDPPDINTTLSESTVVNGQGTFCGDRIKRLTITATVVFHGSGVKKQAPPFTKIITQCFDCKIADIRPVGNKYVLMVKESGKADFDKGDHFFVKYQDNNGQSLGISIGGKPEIHLYKQYFTHMGWEAVRNNADSDLFKGSPQDSNSPKSLIPGWQADAGSISPDPSSNYVADNEGWDDQLQQPGTYPLSMCQNAQQASSPQTGAGGPHIVGGQPNCVLDTGAGYGVEPAFCGPGIEWKDNKHKLSGNKFYFNFGLDDGRSHLFYHNCSEPCTIHGDVWKVWEVMSYEAKDILDTGICPCAVVNKQGPCNCPSMTNPNCCQCHHIEVKGWWDCIDIMIMKNEGEVKGKYRTDNGGWNNWTGKPEKIDVFKNFKSKPDFQNGDSFVFSDFLRGATRRVTDLTADKTLYDGNRLYLEGIVQTSKQENLNLIVNHPGCLLSGTSNSEVDVNLRSSIYAPKNNPFFAPPTALSLVTNGTANLSGTEMAAGICAQNSINGDIKLHGNLVTKTINKGSLSNELLYDSTLLRMSGQFGNQIDRDACFVVSISPIPQEFFDQYNLK